MNQTDIILKAMREGRKLTTQDAIMEYGITRLASRIHDLTRRGYNINKRWKKVPTRLGVDTRVVEYSIDEAC